MTRDEGVILALNVGSSSLKFALFGEKKIASGAVERIGQSGGRLRFAREDGRTIEREGHWSDAATAIEAMFSLLEEEHMPPLLGVGHRLVHGGPNHHEPARVTTELLAALRDVVPFAPLHLPAELDAIEAVRRRDPSQPQVVCFDTAFHRRVPDVASWLPLPRALHDEGLRRYGFHGLSYQYVVDTLGPRLGKRAIVAHLGSGASLAALRDGVSVDTTMGLTPDGGIMMGTRTGDLDPGVVLHLLRAGHDEPALARLLEKEGGLRGVSGSTSDMSELLERRASDPQAALAVSMFTYRVAKAIGSFMAVLGGLDTLVFTGGIGENAAEVRAESCATLAELGVLVDDAKNAAGEAIVSPKGARCTVRVVHTDEEHVVARETRNVLRCGRSI